MIYEVTPLLRGYPIRGEQVVIHGTRADADAAAQKLLAKDYVESVYVVEFEPGAVYSIDDYFVRPGWKSN